MDRVTYNNCIATGLKGKKLGKEERKLEFCIVSKTCSGKSSNREEAKHICSQPKPPKPEKAPKGEKVKASAQLSEGARCLADVRSRVASGELSASTNLQEVCSEVLGGGETGVEIHVGRRRLELSREDFQTICPCAQREGK